MFYVGNENSSHNYAYRDDILAKEFDDLIIGQSKGWIADIFKQMKQKYPYMQADLIIAN